MVHRKRSKIPPTSSTVSSITSLRRVSTTTKPCLQNWKLETNNANYVDSNRSQTKWVIPLSRPPLNLQFLERGICLKQTADDSFTAFPHCIARPAWGVRFEPAEPGVEFHHGSAPAHPAFVRGEALHFGRNR